MLYKPDQSDGVADVMQNIKPSQTLEFGKEYTVEELIRRMIVYSDNGAATLLYAQLNADYLSSIYSDMGVEQPNIGRTENYMSVSEYAAFFRILYNASYLNRDMSEKALNLLSKSEYKNGLLAGVPADIVVSHKFGERIYDNIFQLHDCGVIYHPKSPYILCLMTRGENFANLEGAIKDISKGVYDEIGK